MMQFHDVSKVEAAIVLLYMRCEDQPGKKRRGLVLRKRRPMSIEKEGWIDGWTHGWIHELYMDR